MNQTCYFCGGALVRSDKCRPLYIECSGCHTFFSLMEPDYNYTTGEIRQTYVNRIRKAHTDDLNHYMHFSNTNELKLIKAHKYDNIFTFGGGVPKLESLLTADHIFSYDVNMDLYLEVMDEFCALYNIEKDKITMRSDFVNFDLIRGMEYGENSLITFIHFLEHFSPPDMVKLLDAVPIGVDVLIYQPESSRASSPSWFHFGEKEHLTLIPQDSLVKYLRDWYDADVVTQLKYSHDQFMVFKKRMQR